MNEHENSAAFISAFIPNMSSISVPIAALKFKRNQLKKPAWTALLCLSVGLLTGIASADNAPIPLWKFTPDENWSAEWLDKVNSAPFTLTPDAKGLTVTFTATTAETSCPLRGILWREIEPLGIQPTQFSIEATMTAGAGISLSPRVQDVNGTTYQLTSKPVTGGTLTWDLSVELKNKVLKRDALEPVPAGTVLQGPIYLDEVEVIKTAGPVASVTFTKGEVVDPQHGTMAFGKDVLFKFDVPERWFDVNVFDESIYKITAGPEGTTITYGPTTKRSAFKLNSFNPYTQGGAMGRIARLTTDVEVVGATGEVGTLGLGVKDSEGEVLGSRGVPLVPGHNAVVWDSTNVASPWRGGHNGMVDFPLGLDDYTLVMNPTPIEVKVIFHSATKEALHKLVYQTGYDAGRPRFVWSPGEAATVKVHLTNLGATDYQRPFQITLSTDQEHEIWNRTVPASVSSQGKSDLPINIDTNGLLQGVYILRWASSESSDAISGQALLTVSESAPIRKAKDGEFLYGTDLGGTYEQWNLLDWADWCGVDVVRNAGGDGFFRNGSSERDLAYAESALEALEKRGLKSNRMFFPNTPWDADPAKFDKIIATQAAMASATAAKFKNRFLWYELGNEPSLQPFFFHGPSADYAKIFSAVSDAIKAADPTAIVVNGGWAFAGAGGAEQRAREMAKLIPANKIDGWAYHGHGDGAKAERYWFELAKSTANYPDKSTKPYYETESGLPSTDPITWREQARTLVQKFSFAQSTHVIPCFLWFGLHPMWEWGILENFEEAKPAALAYRVLVQRTRGLKGQDRLDVAGAKGEAYWFTNDEGQTTVVLWSDEGLYTRELALGADSTDVKRYDMFGNATPLALDADGTVGVQVGLDPIYVCSKRPPQSRAVAVLPPPLDLPVTIKVVPGSTTMLTAMVHNHGSNPLQGTVVVTPSGSVPIGATQVPIQIDVGKQAMVHLPLTVSDVPSPWWPRAWVVFAPVVGDLDLSTITAIPDSLPSDGKPLAPQIGMPVNNHLNLAPLGNGYHERRQALCFSRVNVPSDMDVEFGTSADYWMEWWLNGKKIFSTMDQGNSGPFQIMTHTVKAHFNKGQNLLVVRVLSGSAGWELVSGGPEAVASARCSLSGVTDAAIIELKDADKVLDREAVKVEALPPLESRDETSWSNMAPDATLGAINNLFKAAPDQAHWYHGKADLSGNLWYRVQKDGALLIEAAVVDDIDKPGDAIHINIATGDGWNKKLQVSSGQPQVTKRRDDATSITWYEAVIPRSDLGVEAKQPISIQVIVDDDDWGVLKQTATTAFGGNPDNWYQTWFLK